jgi:uncharacterized membrane protein
MSEAMLRPAALCLVVAVLSACGDDDADHAPRADDPADTTAAATPPHAVPPDSPPADREPIAPAPWIAARERGATFRAIGQEPGWHVEIVPGSVITFVGDYGATTIRAPTPEPEQQGGRTIWHAATDTHELHIVVEELPCTDIMSGEEFPLTVTVSADGTELNGCGRYLHD